MGGVRTGVSRGRERAALRRRGSELGMEFVYEKSAEKIPAYEDIVRRAGLPEEAIAYVGDDLPDLPVLARVGLAVAVANAAPEVRRAAHYVALARGGVGAWREGFGLILKAQGKWREGVENAPGLFWSVRLAAHGQ